MRTTLTLDDEIAARLKQAAAREGRPFKDAVNSALRIGLGLQGKPARPARRVALRTFRSKLKLGIDETKLNQLADQVEVESFVAETLKPGRKT